MLSDQMVDDKYFDYPAFLLSSPSDDDVLHMLRSKLLAIITSTQSKSICTFGNTSMIGLRLPALSVSQCSNN